jgi:hypothetical protein
LANEIDYFVVQRCNMLPLEFLDCDLPLKDHKGNKTAQDEAGGVGCLKFGGTVRA